jgi:hypothetical protein
MKSQRNYSKAELTRRLNCEVQAQNFLTKQQIRLEDAQTEPMISLIANDNWAEYTLRYVVLVKKKKIYKIRIVYKILN